MCCTLQTHAVHCCVEGIFFPAFSLSFPQKSHMRMRADEKNRRQLVGKALNCVLISMAALSVFYSSLVAFSSPLTPHGIEAVEKAIHILETRGFEREVFLLRHTATFRDSDNWLNASTPKEASYAATNFPFQIITLYPDFFTKASDDTERAMILLHEARHLQGDSEGDAYAFVWKNRDRLGWTQLSHGTTPTYVTIHDLTRENAPELFTCADKVWKDCTEALSAKKLSARE